MSAEPCGHLSSTIVFAYLHQALRTARRSLILDGVRVRYCDSKDPTYVLNTIELDVDSYVWHCTASTVCDIAFYMKQDRTEWPLALCPIAFTGSVADAVSTFVLYLRDWIQMRRDAVEETYTIKHPGLA